MNDMRLTVKAIATQFGMTLEDMAKRCDIPYNHLKMVSAGNVKMNADDLVKISQTFNIPMENIETNYTK